MANLVTDTELSTTQETASCHHREEGANKFQKAISAWRGK